MTDEEQKASLLDLFGNFISDLMSNKHRGHAGLRPGGGVHPVPGIGTEVGGVLPGERFNTQYTQADIVRAVVDASLAEHVVNVRADGPFSGYVLPSHIFQTTQHSFPALTAGQPATVFRVVNAHPFRLDILLKCVTLTDGAIYIGNNESMDTSNGYPLTQGEVITLPTRSEVYALSTSTAVASIAMITTLREG